MDSSAEFPSFAHRISVAVNSHDIDRVVDCFTEDYVNETPAHPSRGFRGLEQVRRNWSQIFAAVPDVSADVRAYQRNGDEEWSEWEMRGTRRDGTPHLMRGVLLFTLSGDRARAVRFYMEPVDETTTNADEAVRVAVGS